MNLAKALKHALLARNEREEFEGRGAGAGLQKVADMLAVEVLELSAASELPQHGVFLCADCGAPELTEHGTYYREELEWCCERCAKAARDERETREDLEHYYDYRR